MTEWNQEGGDYEVWGATLAEVADEISGREEAGECEWFPHYQLSWDDNRIVTDASVTVTIRVTMPAWARRSEAGDAPGAEWDRWWQALSRHESGHVELAYRYLDDIEQQLVGRTKSEAEAHWAQTLAALAQASTDYDATTQHGLTQGTTLDTSIQ